MVVFVDDLIIYRMKEEQYLLVVNASNIDKDWEWISKYNSSIGATIETSLMSIPC